MKLNHSSTLRQSWQVEERFRDHGVLHTNPHAHLNHFRGVDAAFGGTTMAGLQSKQKKANAPMNLL
jgi:hypothetical protein